ncbi:MAG: preprotein translocase subunit SecE [Pirellulales bacterium]
MAKEKDAALTSLVQEMFQTGRYKRSQGKFARQMTSIAIWFIVGVTAWNLYGNLVGLERYLQYGISSGVLVLGLWFGFRIVNWPNFADFLIAVEAEMNKVTWPSRAELKRSSIVVIVLIFALAAILFSYDFIWQWVFSKLLP